MTGLREELVYAGLVDIGGLAPAGIAGDRT